MSYEERLSVLERSVRRQRVVIVSLVLLIVGAAGVGMSQDERVAPVVRARRFEVVGETGKVMLVLNTDDREGAGLLSIRNLREEQLVRLSAVAGGSGLIKTFNTKGNELVKISSDNGDGVIVVSDPAGRKKAGRLAPGAAEATTAPEQPAQRERPRDRQRDGGGEQ